MVITVAALMVSWLAVAILAILTIYFRRKARLIAARLQLTEERASTLSNEISRHKLLRLLEKRVGVGVGIEYTLEQLQAFDQVQNEDIVREAVVNQWVPIRSIRKDLSSSPQTNNDPFTTVYYGPKSRHEEIIFESLDQRIVRVTETETVEQSWVPPPGYEGSTGYYDPEMRIVVHEITFRPSSG